MEKKMKRRNREILTSPNAVIFLHWNKIFKAYLVGGEILF
jgi:hypothetical protein